MCCRRIEAIERGLGIFEEANSSAVQVLPVCVEPRGIS
jgi:hypothetical protein